MSSFKLAQTSFTRGELTSKLLERYTLDHYQLGVYYSRNYICMRHGPMSRRPPVEYIAEAKYSDKITSIYPFVFGVGQAYILEFGDYYMRVYKNDGRVTDETDLIEGITQASPAVVTATGHAFSNGDVVQLTSIVGMTELNNREFVVANVAANTFELTGEDSTAHTAWSSGGDIIQIVEIATSFTAAETAEINVTQSNDVLYIAHKNHHPLRLTRTSHTSWSLDIVQFTDGPYDGKSDSGTKMTPGATIVANGTITCTFDRVDGINDGDGFTASDVGRYIRYQHPGVSTDLGYVAPTTGQHIAWGQISVINSTTSIDVLWLGTAGIETVSGIDLINNVAESENWWLGEFYGSGTYPAKVRFFDDRLCWARSDNRPGTTWKSVKGGYENYSPTDRDGEVAEDHAMTSTISAGESSEIQWLAEAAALQVGTKSAVRTFQGFDGAALAPDSRKQTRQSTYGCANVTPVQVGNATLYIEYGGYAMREMVYSLQDDAYITPDTSILSDHLATTPIIDMAYCQSPHSLIWSITQGGELLSLTYERDQRTVGWMKQDLDCSTESIASVPGELYSELWLVTNKTINGQTKRYIQRMKNVFSSILHTLDEYAHLDFQVSYDGSAISTLTGVDHLEGETVGVMADGIYTGDATVTNGAVVLPLGRSASKITVGLNYTSLAVSLPPHAPSKMGSTLAIKRKIDGFAVSVMDCVDVEIGVHETIDTRYQRLFGSDYDDDKVAMPELINELKYKTMSGTWAGRGKTFVRISQPYPGVIRAWEGSYIFQP